MEEKKTEFTKEPKKSIIESTEVSQKEMFTIINHNGEFMIALGNQLVSKNVFDCREKTEHYIDQKPWELIFNSMAVLVEKLEILKKQS